MVLWQNSGRSLLENKFLSKLVKDQFITQDEYEWLMAPKKSEECEEEKEEDEEKIVNYAEKNNKIQKVDFSYVQFLKIAFSLIRTSFSKEYIFRKSVFYCSADFSSIKFIKIVDFSHATFKQDVDFSSVIFENNLIFSNVQCNENCAFQNSKIHNKNDQKDTNSQFISFDNSYFMKDVDFQDSIFDGKISFKFVKFKQCAYFDGTTFKKYVTFYQSKFFSTVSFENSEFQGETRFTDVIFSDVANFNAIHIRDFGTFKNIEVDKRIEFNDAMLYETDFSFAQGRNISFKNARLYKIILDNIDFENKNFLELKKYSSDITRTDAIATRESARIIKDTFESQHNIIESNKYYRIEMDLWREEIAQKFGGSIKSFFSNRDFFNLTLFKYVSDYATNWIQVLFWMIIFGFLCVLIEYSQNDGEKSFLVLATLLIVCIFASYKNEFDKILRIYSLIFIIYTLLYFFNNPVDLLNTFAKVIYPATSSEITFVSLIMKLIFGYLAYQFIISMRQNTRRK